MDPQTGKPTGTNCTICVDQPRSAERPIGTTAAAHASPRQVRVEMVVPPGYELVKEEDKNILMGDNYDRAGNAGVRWFRQHLHHPRPGFRNRGLQPQQSADSEH